jgi:putative endonuclease
MAYAFVYIMASNKKGTLYVGVTTDLIKRVHEHKNGSIEGFTKKYKVHTLVYYEPHDDIYAAFQREKQIKKWIEKENPEWGDLYGNII